MSTSLKGKTAVITGSSGGIGAAIAQELSCRGASNVLNYPLPSHEEACKKTGQALHTPWVAVCADLSTADGAKHLIAATIKGFSHIDILVLNAAHFVSGSTEQIMEEEWNAAFNVNVRGNFPLVKAALPHLTPYIPPKEVQLTARPLGAKIIYISSG